MRLKSMRLDHVGHVYVPLGPYISCTRSLDYHLIWKLDKPMDSYQFKIIQNMERKTAHKLLVSRRHSLKQEVPKHPLSRLSYEYTPI